jgi:hypothetical protein
MKKKILKKFILTGIEFAGKGLYRTGGIPKAGLSGAFLGNR